jgi:hypothetical protein
MAGKTLSKASEYEQTFGTRHRGPGRPRVMEDGEVLFPSGDVHPVLVRVAQRRAYAVVHEENRERLHELYLSELAVLKRRGLTVVAEDSGVVLEEDDSSAVAA